MHFQGITTAIEPMGIGSELNDWFTYLIATLQRF